MQDPTTQRSLVQSGMHIDRSKIECNNSLELHTVILIQLMTWFFAMFNKRQIDELQIEGAHNINE